MQTKHEPNEDFALRLESQILTEVRRRSRLPRASRWLLMTPARLALALSAIVLVSMAAGGVAVDAAYRVQNNERRDLIASAYEQRLEVARQRHTLVEEDVNRVRRRVSIGVANQAELLDKQTALAEARAGVRVAELQLEEVRLSGQEPVFGMSAPLVAGRDFVVPRLMAELEVSRGAHQAAEVQLRDAERRVEIGVAPPLDVQTARARISELQSEIQLLERRIETRNRFLSGALDANQAELRALEAEAMGRLDMLRPQIEIARRQVDRVASRVKKGLSEDLELAQVKLKLMTLEADLGKAELDLALVRRRLGGKD